MKVANATLTRIVFIKTPNNKVVVREIDYVPDWEYLKTKNFDISSNSFAAVDNNFSGTLVVKKWSGVELSRKVFENGRAIKKARLTKKAPDANLRSTQTNSTNSGSICETFLIREYERICIMVKEGDEPAVEQCEWVATGVYWYEEICSGDSNCPEGMSPEQCACFQYSLGCDNDENENGNPAPNTDPCSEAQKGSNKATTFAQTGTHSSAKANLISAFQNDNKEHGISFGKDANGQIIPSNITTGGDHSGTVGSVPNTFADMHNHTGESPPSSGDFYGFIDLAKASSLYETRYITTPGGTVYAFIITDLEMAKKFNTDHPRVNNPAPYEPDFPDNLADEFRELKGAYGATDEIAMAYILGKYDAGVALLKQDANGNFKRLNTNEGIDANGQKTFVANNCP